MSVFGSQASFLVNVPFSDSPPNTRILLFNTFDVIPLRSVGRGDSLAQRLVFGSYT